MNDLRFHWNERYRAAEGKTGPARVLAENLHLLPSRGDALELACGLGANALLLAQQRLAVTAWDLSDVAIARLGQSALERRLPVTAEVRDVEADPPAPDSFDVIVVSHFLSRPLVPALIQALRPGGLIYYQTFTRQRVSDRGPRCDDYRLEAQELLRLFSGLQVLVYREEGRVGDLGRGFRDEALLVARRE